MLQNLILSLVMTIIPKNAPNPYNDCHSARIIKTASPSITPIICYGNCNVYIADGQKSSPCPNRATQSTRDRRSYSNSYTNEPQPQEVDTPSNIASLKKQKPVDLTPHTTSLFPTAVTLPKGRSFQDYRFFGMLSGSQYGVTDRLEMGYKIVTPFVFVVMADAENFEPFLKYGVHVNAKYQLVKGDTFNLAISGSGPSPQGEIIATVGSQNSSITGAVGGMHFLDSDMYLAWYRLSGKLRVSKNVQLFGEHLAVKFSEIPDDTLRVSTLALRKFWGKFNVDFGAGIITYNHEFGFPVMYLNFGYSE
jgi:hypothetical protein